MSLRCSVLDHQLAVERRPVALARACAGEVGKRDDVNVSSRVRPSRKARVAGGARDGAGDGARAHFADTADRTHVARTPGRANQNLRPHPPGLVGESERSAFKHLARGIEHSGYLGRQQRSVGLENHLCGGVDRLTSHQRHADDGKAGGEQGRAGHSGILRQGLAIAGSIDLHQNGIDLGSEGGRQRRARSAAPLHAINPCVIY